MMTDESVIEWAKDWLNKSSLTLEEKARFLKGLSHELGAREVAISKLRLSVLALDADDSRLPVYVRDLQRVISAPVIATRT